MKSKIHYEDDLFFLTLQMRHLREGFQLSIDPDYFLDKILTDLQFIDATLGRIYATLRENRSLIKRAEYLHSLMKTKTTFCELLKDILNTSLPFAESVAPFFPELQARQKVHEADILEIRRQLRDLSRREDNQEDLITAEELEILMRPDPDQESP